MVINVVGLLAFCYASVTTRSTLPVWNFLIAVSYLPLLSCLIGFKTAYSICTNDTRRYDVFLERETLSSVRLLHASPAGILYVAGNGGPACFVNMSNVTKVAKVKL
ncbi:hypothetical protein ACSHT2_13675 [Bradyrhizobium sp. PUT101]|uniref:hypothetical protein n=1 Tax=Bradyrhizobium sp. PUT101 TaxID=3447427 RepID=UPI003F842CD7